MEARVRIPVPPHQLGFRCVSVFPPVDREGGGLGVSTKASKAAKGLLSRGHGMKEPVLPRGAGLLLM